MSCQHLPRNAKPASWRHRLRCTECRTASAADRIIARDLKEMKAGSAPADGLAQTLAAIESMSRMPGGRKSVRRPFYRRLHAPAGTVSAAFAVFSLAWMHYIEIDPNVKVPTPTMPAVNAFDLFRAAGAAERDSAKVDNALTYRSSTPTAGLKPPPIGPSKPVVPTTERTYSLAEQEALIRENAEALRLLRKGFGYPYQAPPVRSFQVEEPSYATFRSLARLLALEAQTRGERGDWSGAANSDLDALQMGVQMPHGAALIGKLVGIACEAIGRRGLWDTVDRLNAEQARKAAQRLERIRALQVPFADTLQEEKWFGQAAFQEMLHQLRNPRWRAEADLYDAAGNSATASPPVADIARIIGHVKLCLFTKSQLLDNYTRYMDQEIANARLPYASRPAAPALPADPLTPRLLDAGETWRLHDLAGSEVQDALLETALALRAYRLEHHAYPQGLDALAPKYLHEVPEDPFAMHGHLRYRRVGTRYVLYSIGPDGKDDGGRPIYKKVLGDYGHEYDVRQDSIRDIVAGVNLH